MLFKPRNDTRPVEPDEFPDFIDDTGNDILMVTAVTFDEATEGVDGFTVARAVLDPSIERGYRWVDPTFRFAARAFCTDPSHDHRMPIEVSLN